MEFTGSRDGSGQPKKPNFSLQAKDCPTELRVTEFVPSKPILNLVYCNEWFLSFLWLLHSYFRPLLFVKTMFTSTFHIIHSFLILIFSFLKTVSWQHDSDHSLNEEYEDYNLHCTNHFRFKKRLPLRQLHARIYGNMLCSRMHVVSRGVKYVFAKSWNQ